MHQSTYIYHHKNTECHGHLAFDDNQDKKRPAIIIAHDWTGRNAFAENMAQAMAQKGYLGFALDMYGLGRTGQSVDEKMALMNPLVNDRELLAERIRAAYDALLTIPEVDHNHIAAIGFCFGGLCVLDLARSGLKLSGVVSVHGLLNRAEHSNIQPISAKVLALHGYDDPMVTPDQVLTFCQEMNDCDANWQMHMYGQVQHAFTNPLANDHALGTVFNALANQRAMLAIDNFLSELFG